MYIAIVDDNKECCDTMLSYLDMFSQETGTEITASAYTEPNRFLDEFEHQFDILIVDVEMPSLDGISLSQMIREKDPHITIMFITNLAQYAIKGYEVEAVDYVLKPITYVEFTTKIKKAIRVTKQKANPTVLLTTTEGIVSVDIADIQYIEVRSHYLYYHLDKEELKVRDTMKNAEESFKRYGFYRINYGYLVNMKAISRIDNNVLTVGDNQLTIARNRRKDFMKIFALYINGYE